MTGRAEHARGPSPEGLLCAIALDPTSLPRNRYYWVYADVGARRAHGRAYALRRLREELVDLACPFTVVEEERGILIAYRDAALSLLRRVHLSALEASVLRVLLARQDVRVPALLRVNSDDRRRVASALGQVRGYPGLPDPAGWDDILEPIPLAPPSNTTE